MQDVTYQQLIYLLQLVTRAPFWMISAAVEAASDLYLRMEAGTCDVAYACSAAHLLSSHVETGELLQGRNEVAAALQRALYEAAVCAAQAIAWYYSSVQNPDNKRAADHVMLNVECCIHRLDSVRKCALLESKYVRRCDCLDGVRIKVRCPLCGGHGTVVDEDFARWASMIPRGSAR